MESSLPDQQAAYQRLLARIRDHDAACLAVYLREREQRPHWPRTYAEAIAHPMTAAALLLLATRCPATHQRPAYYPPEPPADLDPPAINRAPARASHGRRAPVIDGKSLAAGEKPDSDND